MLNKLREFHASFHDSEVILWARSQYLMLAIYTALQSVDMSAIISDRHLLQGYIFANAMVTELLRRSREEWKDHK
jgi:hypothetical protein